MILLFLDSFDHYTAFTQKWTSTQFANGTLVPGRNGMGMQPTPFGSRKLLAADPGIDQLAGGLAYKTSGLANGPIVFRNSTLGAYVQLLHIGDGRLCVDTFIGRSGPAAVVLNRNQWYYLELSAKVSYSKDFKNATVFAHVRVNEQPVLSVIMTKFVGSFKGNFTELRVQSTGGGLLSVVDDVYVVSGWDPIHETWFLGDVGIQPIWPNAFGISSQWTPVPPGNNWEKVKDPTPDDDTSYVFVMGPTQDLNAIDLYNLTDLVVPNGGKVRGIQAMIYARAISTDNLDKILFKYTLGLAFNGGSHLSGSGYSYEFETFRYNPLSTLEPLDFSVADINIMQFGQQYVREI